MRFLRLCVGIRELMHNPEKELGDAGATLVVRGDHEELGDSGSKLLITPRIQAH